MALSDFYQYYFFERQDEMSYRVPAATLGRDDTIGNLVAENTGAVDAFLRKYEKTSEYLLNQSFMTAAKAFRAIDAPTQGVIVPYGVEGADIVVRLFAAFDVELDVPLLRRAQQYTVNVFPHVLEKLLKVDAVREAKPDTRILDRKSVV